MAQSKFEYVRKYELPDTCLLNTWIVVRVDGVNFHKFSEQHKFVKPNDEKALRLMSVAAQDVMKAFFPGSAVSLAYGQSDEYSFVFYPDMKMFNRRASKILSHVVSTFTSSYVLNWPSIMSEALKYPPAFDARLILYPSAREVRDYLSWRQADCHINNLYNTCFWSLVKRSLLTPQQAELRLRGTRSSDKNELLYSEFELNYNNEPPQFRKGTVLFYEMSRYSARDAPDRGRGGRNTRRADCTPERVLVGSAQSLQNVTQLAARAADMSISAVSAPPAAVSAVSAPTVAVSALDAVAATVSDGTPPLGDQQPQKVPTSPDTPVVDNEYEEICVSAAKCAVVLSSSGNVEASCESARHSSLVGDTILSDTRNNTVSDTRNNTVSDTRNNTVSDTRDTQLKLLHVDIIGRNFWNEHNYLLSVRRTKRHTRGPMRGRHMRRNTDRQATKVSLSQQKETESV